MMKIALIYPPTCDPTAPYLSLPTLAGYLRAHGVEVRPIDANVEAYGRLLSRETLTVLAGRVEERWTKLKRKSALNHAEQLAGAAERVGLVGLSAAFPRKPARSQRLIFSNRGDTTARSTSLSPPASWRA